MSFLGINPERRCGCLDIPGLRSPLEGGRDYRFTLDFSDRRDAGLSILCGSLDFVLGLLFVLLFLLTFISGAARGLVIVPGGY